MLSLILVQIQNFSDMTIFEPVQPSPLSISSAHNSASIIVGAFVFPEIRSGITELVSILASSSGTLDESDYKS